MNWTHEDQEQALKEGWGIWSVDSEQSRLQLQRHDDSKVFSSDMDALQFVLAKKCHGSIYAKAVQVLESPLSWSKP